MKKCRKEKVPKVPIENIEKFYTNKGKRRKSSVKETKKKSTNDGKDINFDNVINDLEIEEFCYDERTLERVREE